jgi:hypothetical protein
LPESPERISEFQQKENYKPETDSENHEIAVAVSEAECEANADIDG